MWSKSVEVLNYYFTPCAKSFNTYYSFLPTIFSRMTLFSKDMTFYLARKLIKK